MRGNFTVGSWNTAGSVDDYTQVSPEAHKLISEGTSPNGRDAMIQKRNEIEDIAGESLKSSADVFCLQEVHQQEGSQLGEEQAGVRRIVQKLDASGFQILRPSVNSDTVVAVNEKKFKNITDESVILPHSQMDCAIAVATEKSSGKKFAFVSVHIAGFGIRAKDQKLTDDEQKKIKEDEAERGDKQIEELITYLNQNYKHCDGIVIGGDFNVIHNRHEASFARLDLLKNAGYEIQKSLQPTNKVDHGFAGRHTGPETRELDYFAVKINSKKTLMGRVKSFFKFAQTEKKLGQTEKNPALTSIEEPIRFENNPYDPGFDPEKNPSDHRPIYMRIEITSSNSLLEYIKNINFSPANLFKRLKK